MLFITMRGVVGSATVPQQHPQCEMPSQAYVNFAMGPTQVVFFFRVKLLLISLCWCLLCCLLSPFRF